MRITFALFLSFILLLGCESNKSSSEDDAKALLAEVLEVYNTDDFFKSTITFNTDELEYTLKRDGYISNFQLIRRVDTITYKATYNNGQRRYYINDSLQEESNHGNLFIDIKLEGFCYLFSLPREFDRNHVKLNMGEDVVIKKKNYHTLNVSFTRVSEDDPNDEFILYVEPETKYVKYYAEYYSLAPGDRKAFKVAHNFRTIEGILFADYFALTPTRDNFQTAQLNDLYELYNANDLDELESLIYENIEVTLH